MFKHPFKTLLSAVLAAVTAAAWTGAARAQSSPNLGITHIEQSQSQKEVTANAATDALDVALTDFLAVDFTAGDVTLTSAQFREHILFRAANLGADQALTVPQLKRLFVVHNPDAGDTVTVTRGATTVPVGPGETRVFYTDGTANGLTVATTAFDFLGLSDTPSSYVSQAGKAVVVNGGETGLSFSTIAGGGGGGGESGPWRFIETQVASATAALDFVLPDGYEQYVLTGWVQPATDDADLLLRVSADGGSNFDAGAGDYDWQLVNLSDGGSVSGVTADANGPTTGINVFGFGLDSGSANHTNAFKITVFNAADSRYTAVTIAATHGSNAGAPSTKVGGGWRAAAAAHDALRLVFTSGNIALGRVSLYGLRAANPALPYRVDAWATTGDKLTISSTMHLALAGADVTFADEFAGCHGYALTAPSGGNVVFNVDVEGSTVGTVTFADSSNTATCATTGAEVAWDAGERLEIVAPADLEGMDGVAIMLPGTTPSP